MKKLFLIGLMAACIPLFARENRKTENIDDCSAPDGACNIHAGPIIAKTFCPSSGCPCTAKICKECEDCPM